MNWLKTLINRQASARRFNLWRVLAWPKGPVNGADAEGETGHTRATQPGTAPQPPHAPKPAPQPTITETAHELPLPDDGEPDQEALGIGACVIPPWQFHVTEEEMQNTQRTICVSDRDLGLMRALVAAALKTHGGTTLEYVRLLDGELRQARVLPVSRLPRDIIALNSRVWVTGLDSGEKTVVTLAMPDHAAGTPDRISILSPLGMALFGYATGDSLDWGPLQRPIRLRVDRVKQSR